MFFPFSRNSRVDTQKTCYSNNHNRATNHFRMSIIDVSPVIKNTNQTLTNSMINGSETDEEDAPEKYVNDSQKKPFSFKLCYKSFVIGIGVGISCVTLLVTAIRFIQKHQQKKLKNMRLIADNLSDTKEALHVGENL